jgi:transposase
MKREKKHYSKEFKIKAVELSNQRLDVINVAKELDISYDNLKRWKKEYKSGKFSEIKIKTPEQEEIARLKKELHDIKMERDILKKAVSIFSKNDR